MGTFEKALSGQTILNDVTSFTSEALNKYPKGDMGLTPDHVKATPRWQKEKREFETSLRNLREFNTVMLRKYKKEYRNHIKIERENKAIRAAKRDITSLQSLGPIDTPFMGKA